MDLKSMRHDLMRNVSGLMSGTNLLLKKKLNSDERSSVILSQMNKECESTLLLLEELFKNLEMNSKLKKGEGK